MNFLTRWLRNQSDYRRLAAIKRDVDQRIHYTDRGTKDRVYVPKDESAEADCEAFAESYVVDCGKAGYKDVQYYQYVISSTKSHAVCFVTTPTAVWRLDCLEKDVRRV